MTEFLTRENKRRIESFRRVGEDVLLGKVIIETNKCTGCGYCTRACAAYALEVVNKKCKMADGTPFCISCGDCVAICPEGAIELVEFIQFKHYFKYLDRGVPEPPRQF